MIAPASTFQLSPLPRDISGVIAMLLRILFGTWFVYAGGLKIFGSGLERFALDIENYRLVSGNFALAAAYLLPFLEVFAGLCFMLGFLVRGAWVAMFGMVSAFSIAVASAWWRGLDISCGCLGGSEKISYWRKAIEFAIYYGALGWIAYNGWKLQQKSIR